MTFEPHLERNFLLILVNHRHRQSETHNREIDGRARRSERNDPSALTTALISNPGTALTGNSLRFAHGSHSVVCERIEILRVFAFGAAGSSFVINEGANIFGG